jgi:hypothetical protein
MASRWFEPDGVGHSGAFGRRTDRRDASRPISTEVIPRDDSMWRWLVRCREIADGPLEGIEAPAEELAVLASGDREMMERARHQLLDALEHEPHNSTLRQMLALWQRAFEKGHWSWPANPWDDSPILS